MSESNTELSTLNCYTPKLASNISLENKGSATLFNVYCTAIQHSIIQLGLSVVTTRLQHPK